MGIQQVKLTGENGTRNKDGRTYSRAYKVKIGLTDNIGTVYAAVWTPTTAYPYALPTYGNGLKTWDGITDIDAEATVSDIQVDLALDEQPADGWIYDYQVQYQFDPSFAGIEDPLDRPADISLDVNYVEEDMLFDEDGVAVTNSLKTRLDNPPKREVGSGVIVIERNEAANPIGKINTYCGTVTENAWYDVAEQKARIKISAQKQYENNFNYWRVRYEIQCSRSSFRAKTLDYATNEYVLVNGVKKEQQILDHNGVPTKVLLDGSGQRLAFDADPVEYPEDGWKRYPETNWSGLDLPNPFTA